MPTGNPEAAGTASGSRRHRDRAVNFVRGHLETRRVRAAAAMGLALVAWAVACVEAQPMRSIRRFNTDAGTLAEAIPVSRGLLVIQRTPTRTVRELFSREGKSLSRTATDRRVLQSLVDGERITSIEEIAPGLAVIVQGSLGEELGVVSNEANWTDLVRAPSGDILAVESLFLSRDIAPSACRIRNVTKNRVEFEDNFSYHYPVAGQDLLLVSPIDRKVRRLSGGFATELGSVNSMENLPIVSPSGKWTAWFGPVGTSSSLFVSQPSTPPMILDPNSPERPMIWLGENLLVAFQDDLSKRWTLKLFSVPDGLIRATFPIPDNVDPRQMLGSPGGDYIGLPTDRGSIMIRVSDHFIQALDGVPLSSWQWSPDGAALYLLTQEDLSVITLR
jgi:hypothetical protein